MTRWTAGALGLAALAAACAVDEMPQPPEGRALFAENCALCHGADARGGGPIAEGIEPPPPDLTRISTRYGGSFPRAHVLNVIDGYTRMQLPGQDMPEFGALLEGETVPVDTGDGMFSPVPRPLAALMIYLESIQQQP